MSQPHPIESFLDAFEGRALPLYKAAAEMTWQAATSGTDEAAAAAAAAETAYRRLFADREDLARLRNARASLAGTVTSASLKPGASAGIGGSAGDPAIPEEARRTARRVQILIHEFTGNQMDPVRLEEIVRRQKEIETSVARFRAEVNGQRLSGNEVVQLLRTSADPEERRRVWEASKAIGSEIAEPLLALVRLRNEEARGLGFPDYYEMALELQEISPSELTRLCDRFEALTDAPFLSLRQEMDRRLSARFSIRPDRLRPWHYEDPFFQEAPAEPAVDLAPVFAGHDLADLAAGFFRGIGLPVEETLARSDLYEREGKSPHAFCIHIDRSGDIRLLCNLRPDDRWMAVLLHECGHAVYESGIDPALPFTLRTPAHSFLTEAIANLFGREARLPAFLEGVVGLPGELGSALEREGSRGLRAQMLVATRWMLVMIHFERELYREPGQDLGTLWWDLVERYQFLRRPEGRDRPDWASKIHLTSYPVYYHSYLLGELAASQIRASLEEEIPEIRGGTLAGKEGVGEFLRRRIFTPGALYRWDELLVRATGSNLDPAPFVRQFAESGPRSS